MSKERFFAPNHEPWPSPITVGYMRAVALGCVLFGFLIGLAVGRFA